MFAELRRAGDKITVTFIRCSEPGTKQVARVPGLTPGVRIIHVVFCWVKVLWIKNKTNTNYTCAWTPNNCFWNAIRDPRPPITNRMIWGARNPIRLDVPKIRTAPTIITFVVVLWSYGKTSLRLYEVRFVLAIGREFSWIAMNPMSVLINSNNTFANSKESKWMLCTCSYI